MRRLLFWVLGFRPVHTCVCDPQLGYGDTAQRVSVPGTDISIPGTVTEIAAGFDTTCARLTTGTPR